MLKNKMLSAMGGAPANYIEDVFSTWLYTGNGSTQTITNGIDLAGEGGMVWTKSRSLGTTTGSHTIYDTERGFISPSNAYFLETVNTDAQGTNGSTLTSFNSDGFSLGTAQNSNYSGSLQASWTFRKQPKFFDVVTYTGTGVARTVAHNLGSVPGCIIVKRTDAAANWQVYHRANTAAPETDYLVLNSTAATADLNTVWNDTAPTDSVFSVGTNATVNASGGTYVAYLFAHDAGGFGLTGTDNVISCGSFTTDGSGAATVDLGYEPQWLLYKRTNSSGDWQISDSMRGLNNTELVRLVANTSGAETVFSDFRTLYPTATGFNIATGLGANTPYIYIAIRRGPMKVPTSGTSVFAPIAISADNTTISTGFPVDMFLENLRTGSAANTMAMDRLRGSTVRLTTSSTNAESSSGSGAFVFDDNTGYQPDFFVSGSIVSYAFRRAPGFFDEVCYTGTGANANISHNLGAVPELMIVKRRNSTGAWIVYSAATGNGQYLILNTTAAANADGGLWRSTTPTSSLFYVDGTTDVNASGGTFVAYLFASAAGVSKVGSYTGNSSSQTINCGFTNGARFVMIKRTDNAGDWYVWDSARGITSGNDPYLLLNKTDPEITTNDTIDPDSSGFIVNSTFTDLNGNGASYIYLAIA